MMLLSVLTTIESCMNAKGGNVKEENVRESVNYVRKNDDAANVSENESARDNVKRNANRKSAKRNESANLNVSVNASSSKNASGRKKRRSSNALAR